MSLLKGNETWYPFAVLSETGNRSVRQPKHICDGDLRWHLTGSDFASPKMGSRWHMSIFISWLLARI